MRSRAVLFFLAYTVWTLLNWPPDWQHALIGLFVSSFVAFLTGDLFPVRFEHLFDIKRYFWALYYVPIFLWECIKANLDVAYRVIHPDLPIKPGIVKVKTALKTDLALTLLAISITLTPGTMCVDVDKDKGILYIHWISVSQKDIEPATRIIAQKFETLIKRILE